MTEETITQAKPEENHPGSPLIIGIGASAGGLEALQQFFQHMPSNSGLSFVVIQHLSPDYKSLMADILGKHTQMHVLQAENEMTIRPNTVYLIPPKNNMTIRDGKLYLNEFVHGMLNHPIDVFFTSLAEEQKERAIAVVMSGTGSDGTSGIKIVKEHGGLVIVQAPESAKFDGMPRSAINTGLADFVLSPDGIVDEILNFSSYPTIIRPQEKEELFFRRRNLCQDLRHPEKKQRHRFYQLQADHGAAAHRAPDGGHPQHRAAGLRQAACRQSGGSRDPGQGDPHRRDQLFPRPRLL